ncbi:MAG: bifunctional diaminohydroxyphosphoribosylaminopyrimidine deaminase/5-amino-6-(5-phosphoribosylamino)uracil reductase RibD, partial [Chloroflexi bacterium]|nr:bifunctional diaminohydroxyphosphoribosylaminopyrimidine deaminase/5-amino-6-(5-phosphoribosylamino)uracil reductase RibD [Chloroflexota bacterium]
LARGRTAPRPPVGAVIVRDGSVVGAGFTQPRSGPHAEVVALQAAGDRAQGATLYVTLEPCSHYGRTPPCADAIIAAGIRRVIASWQDPNPLVCGQGFHKLRESGIAVEIGDGAEEALQQLAPFFTAVTRDRPLVTAKWAMSADGKIATHSGDSRWISSEASRAVVHEIRDVVDAIVVGISTVIADDPRLTVRLPDHLGRRAPRLHRPLRVVLDSHGRLPLCSGILTDDHVDRTVVFTTSAVPTERVTAIAQRGALLIQVSASPKGQVDPSAVLQQLLALDCYHVLVEGGGRVLGSFFDHRLVDEAVIFVAPRVIGGGEAPGPVAGTGVSALTAAARIDWSSPAAVGQDAVLRGRVSFPSSTGT